MARTDRRRGHLRAAVPLLVGLSMLGGATTGWAGLARPDAERESSLQPSSRWISLARLGDAEEDEVRVGRYSLLVRKVQLRLAEIGLYKGAIGGVMSPETAEAIRRYQQMSSLPVDGKPSAGLLEHLTSAAGAAQHLLLRLDEARRSQITEARLALEREFGADWVRPEARAQNDDRASPAQCFDVPTPTCLISEARSAAGMVAKEDLRDWALSNVVEAQARAGQPDAALEIARTIQDPRSVVAAISSIAVSLAKVGRTDEALATAERVPSLRLKDKALRAITEGQAAAGQADIARVTASRIERDQERVLALAAIARSYLAAGDKSAAHAVVEEARGLVRTIDTAVFRDWARSEVAVLLARSDDVAAAKSLAGRIDTEMHRIQALCEIVVIESEAGSMRSARETLQQAKQLLSSIPHRAARQQAYARLAVAEAAVGEFEVGLKTARKIDLGYTRSFVMTQIAVSLARAARIDEAITLATSVDDDRLKVDTLLSIARILSDGGDGARARTTEAESYQIARSIKSTLDRAFVLSDLAVVDALAGKTTAARATLTEALDVARAIEDPWARARSLSKVASALALIDDI